MIEDLVSQDKRTPNNKPENRTRKKGKLSKRKKKNSMKNLAKLKKLKQRSRSKRF